MSLAELAAFFTDDVTLASELELAARPAAYKQRFPARVAARGGSPDAARLAVVALLDGLAERGLLALLGGKADADEVRAGLKKLGVSPVALRSVSAGTSTENMLARVGAKLDGQTLVSLAHGADEHAVAVIASDRLAELERLAPAVGRVVVHRFVAAPRKKTSPRGRGFTVDHAWDGRPVRVVALPDGRALALEREQTLCVFSEQGIERIPIWEAVMPGLSANSPSGQVSLFVSGGGFGLLSPLRVVYWPEGRLGERLSFELDPALPVDRFGRSAAPIGVGVSDEAGVVACVFHEPGNLTATTRLGLLRLKDGRAHREETGDQPTWRREDFPMSPAVLANPGLFANPLMDGLARLGGRTLAFLAGLSRAREYSLLVARGTPAKTLLSLPEPACGRFCSSGRYLLLDYQDARRKPAQELYDLGEGQMATSFEPRVLARDQRLVDHAGDFFWVTDHTRLIRGVAA